MVIVIPTPKKLEEFHNSTEYRCLQKLMQINPHELTLDIIPENTKGLSELYNAKLKEHFTQDYCIFMHDDVEIHDMFFVEKLKTAHKFYDIVGLAGSTTQDYSKSPLAWHHCMKQPNDARGFVSHYIPEGFVKNPKGFYNSMFFGPTPDETVMVDGLFISINMASVDNLEQPLFDEEFTFHFYDMYMACAAKKMGLKIGVFPIFVIHHGLGQFHNDPLWQELSAKFKTKYGHIRNTVS